MRNARKRRARRAARKIGGAKVEEPAKAYQRPVSKPEYQPDAKGIYRRVR